MSSAAPVATARASIPAGVECWPVEDRAAWLERRQADVTASAIGALLGVHDYATPLSLYMLKAGLIAEDPAEPTITETSIKLPPMMRGNVFEDDALALVGMLRPRWSTEPVGIYYRDPEVRIGATPDAFAIDPGRPGFGIVQIKSVEQSVFRAKWMDPETREVSPPTWIALQAIVEAHLTGASWACVAAMVIGFGIDLHLVEVPIHAGILDRLKAEVGAFWRGVEAGVPPDADLGRDGALIEQMWRGGGPEKDLRGDNEVLGLVDERERLSVEKGAAEKRLKDIKTALMAKVGPDAATARLADGRAITIKRVERKGYTVEPSSYADLRIKRSAT